jgi:hypothetical protein
MPNEALRNPQQLAALIVNEAPDPGYLATLLYAMAGALVAKQESDLNVDWQDTISKLEFAADAAYVQQRAIERRAADAADALVAAESDERRQRRIDAELERGVPA